MTITDKQAMREKFERAMADKHFGASFERRTDGEYLYANTEFAWRSWSAALEAAEAVRETVLPADERDKFEELMRAGGADTTMYGNVYVDESVQRARSVWVACHMKDAAPSSAEQPAPKAQEIDLDGCEPHQYPWGGTEEMQRNRRAAAESATAPGAPEADERADFEAWFCLHRPFRSVARRPDQQHLYAGTQASTDWEAWQGAWQARAQSSAAPSVAPVSARDGGVSFQQRVQPWMLECFGAEISADRVERNHRFAEEAMELVQANGMPREDAHALVDYVYNRPVGELTQEVGGVMVTLAALCLASGADMHCAAETELARINAPGVIEKIRAKQAAKPRGSALPVATPPADARDGGNYNEGTVVVPVKELRELLDGSLAAAVDAMPLAGDSIDFIEARGGADADEATDRIAYHLFYSMFAADKLRALLPVVADRAMGGE